MEDLNDEEKWRLSVLPFTADKATITNPIQVAIGLWGSVWQEKTLEKWLIFLRFWDHKTRPPNNALMLGDEDAGNPQNDDLETVLLCG